MKVDSQRNIIFLVDIHKNKFDHSTTIYLFRMAILKGNVIHFIVDHSF